MYLWTQTKLQPVRFSAGASKNRTKEIDQSTQRCQRYIKQPTGKGQKWEGERGTGKGDIKDQDISELFSFR